MTQETLEKANQLQRMIEILDGELTYVEAKSISMESLLISIFRTDKTLILRYRSPRPQFKEK